MRRVADERGFTLIEILVALLITSLLMAAIVALFTSFIDDNRYDTLRDDSQANAQTIVDRISRDLRTASAPSVGASTISKAGAYDLVFQAVNATPGSAPSGNAQNEMWERYCLDSNYTLWRQTTSPSSSASTSSTAPDTSACPSTNSAWVTTSSGAACCQELNDVVNEIGNDNRALFQYYPSSSPTSGIKSIQIDAFVDKNPGLLPGSAELTSGVFLRNALAAPTALFVATPTEVFQGTDDVNLNATSAYDPQGQALSYQWYNGTSCSSATQIPGATSQIYDAGDFTSSQTFGLIVTDTAGLASSCQTKQVTIP
jgi:prepilin-type N-terminal cleavage/methylation domain-containing protein